VPVAAGLLKPLPVATHLLADTAYDADHFRAFLIERGSTPVIPPNPTRTNLPTFDQLQYKNRNVIERAFPTSKTGAAWQPATTSWPDISAQPCSWPLCSFGGRN
jgi:transposase